MQNSLNGPIEAPENQEFDVEAKLLYATYKYEPVNQTMAVVTAVFGGALVWDFFPNGQLIPWIVAVILSASLGHLQYRFFKKTAPAGKNIKKWQKIIFLQAFTHGAAWSLGPSLMLPHCTGVMPAFFIGTLLCVSAVTLNTIAKQFFAMQGFLIGCLLPPVLSMWFFGAHNEILLILVLLASMAAFFIVGYFSYQSARTIYETQFQLRGILNSSQDAIITIDSKGRVFDWNPKAEVLFGWKRAEALGLILNDTITPLKNREHFRNGMKRFLALGEGLILNKCIETSALRKDGSEFPVELTLTHHKFGREFFFSAFITDITERKATESRLALFRRVFQASSQCVGISDGKGYLLYQNKALENTLGYPDEEIIGKHFTFALPEDCAEKILSEVRRSIKNGKNWAGELPHRRKDGSVFVTMSNIGFIKDDMGDVQYIFNIWNDFTLEIARRNELAQAKEEADRANQAKSDFLSSMSHELRTPMNAILGFAQMLEYDTSFNSDQQDSVQEILKGGRHLLALINEVLELAKIESGHVNLSMEPVSLADLVSECFDMIRPLASEKRLLLRYDVDAQIAVHADRVRLKQVLLNLLSNAIKYNREKGSVTVAAKMESPDTLHITIADTGIGIRADRMDELFQAFNRLGAEQGETEGTGIGLTITQKLLGLMGGKIGVESEVDHGTCFWIELPADVSPELANIEVAAQLPVALQVQQKNSCILYIDDNPVNLKLLTQVLNMRPHVKLLTAHTPALGIEMAHQYRPDIILLDVNMPEMNGYQVLSVLRVDGDLKSCMIIALTANAMKKDMERGLAAGFDSYLTKPLNVDLFLALIDRCFTSGTAGEGIH